MDQKRNAQQKQKNLKSTKNSPSADNKIKFDAKNQYTPRKYSGISKASSIKQGRHSAFRNRDGVKFSTSSNPNWKKYKYVTEDDIGGIVDSGKKKKSTKKH